MTTYLVGTDGPDASTAIRAELRETVEPGDSVHAVYVATEADPDEVQTGHDALALFRGSFPEAVTVEPRLLNRGSDAAEELLVEAEEVDADRIVIAARPHSRAERFVFGSVSHELLERTTKPVTLVPLDEQDHS